MARIFRAYIVKGVQRNTKGLHTRRSRRRRCCTTKGPLRDNCGTPIEPQSVVKGKMTTTSNIDSSLNETKEDPTMAAKSVNEILAEMSRLQAQVLEMQQENQNLKIQVARPQQKPFLAVAEKGGLSLYRINTRFPVTLYKNQWLKLLDMADDIRAFIKEHDKELKDPPKLGRPPQGHVEVNPTVEIKTH